MHVRWIVLGIAVALVAASVLTVSSGLRIPSTLAATDHEPEVTGLRSAPALRVGPLGAGSPSARVTLVPSPNGTPEICANGTPSDPFPVSYLPYGYETPNLFGLGSGSSGTDDVCYSGGGAGAVSNVVNFSNVGGAEGVLGFPHVEYGQDLWGGSPGNMSPEFELPEPVATATNSSLWLTNTYSINDSLGSAAYDYVWDNFLSSYVPTPANVTGPGNFSLEIMLWMSTGQEGSPFTYFPYEGVAELPTLVNSTLSDQPWDFSHFCQGTNDSELTALYFYNGTQGAMNASARTLAVNFSAVLVNLNQMIQSAGVSCWSYGPNNDANLYLDDLNLGSEFLSPFPSSYYGQAVFNWTLSSMCFTFPQGTPTAASVSCGAVPYSPLSAQPSATPLTGRAPLQVTFDAGASGGVSPYSYNWSFGSGATSTAADPVYDYEIAGTYAVNLTVADQNGSSVRRSLTIDVLPSRLEVQIAASSTSGFAPLHVHLASTVTGGLPPYAYEWTVAGAAAGTGPTAAVTCPTAGVFVITLWVNDSEAPTPQGNTSSLEIVVAVGPTAGGGLGSGLFWLVTGLVVLAVAVCAAAVLVSRRRPPEPAASQLPER